MNLQRNAFGHQIALLVRIIITADDGTELRIGSDDSWKASFGPLLKSDLFLGEVYDARLEQEGWDTPEFDDSKWNFTQILPFEEKKQFLLAQYGPPVRKNGCHFTSENYPYP